MKKSTDIMNFYSREKVNQTIDYIRAQLNNNKIKNKTAYFISSLKEEWILESNNTTCNRKIFTPKVIEKIELGDPLWTSILQCLLDLYGSKTYISWFSKLKFVNYDNDQGLLHLKVDTKFYKNWLSNNYMNGILKAAQSVNANIKDIEINI